MRILTMFAGVVVVGLGLGLAACAGDAPGSSGTPNCTQALYDVCVTEHDCMSGNCFNFATAAFQACTQACDAATPCPDQDGQAVTCEGGVCQPPMATDCKVVP